MPRIFDNIEQSLWPVLAETLKLADRADFCVGYFNLRGWRSIDSYVEQWDGGEEHCCRVRVRTRLRENAEVVGMDEAFFEDEDKMKTKAGNRVLSAQWA